MVEDLSRRYADRAVFIHIEIWKDLHKQVLNQAALDWLSCRTATLTEPWLFLIGADGARSRTDGARVERVGGPDRARGAPADARVAADLRATPTYRAKHP